MKAFIKKHKKLLIILLIILLLLGVAAGVYFFKFRKINNNKNNEYTYTRTVTLSKGSLDETVSANGTVESQSVANVTSSVNYNVKTINVQVGDVVKEGDVICVLDTSDLLKQIEKKKEQLQDQIDNAEDNYDKAYDNLDDAEDAYDEAEDNYYVAKDAYESAKKDYEIANNSIDAFLKDYEDAIEDREAAGLEYNSAIEAYDKAVDSGISEDINNALTTLNEKEQIYNDAKQAEMDAQSELESAKQRIDYTKYESAYNAAEKEFNSASTALNSADSKLDSAYETFYKAEDNLEDAKEDEDLTELYEEYSKCTIKATMSGTITSLNLTVGSKPNGTIATIQDTDHLKVSISIDEYDVNSLEIGMKATITSDASDITMSGYLSQLSPVASSQGMGSSSSTFKAEVIIDEKDASLLIGMNAKATIIVSSVDDVFTVPYDAVEEVDGKYYIYVRNGEDFVQTEVNVGEQNDYYIEVYGENISEGMVVRASANEDEATETTSQGEQGFNFPGVGGFGGGDNMPSGNFQGGGSSGGGNMPSGGPGGF